MKQKLLLFLHLLLVPSALLAQIRAGGTQSQIVLPPGGGGYELPYFCSEKFSTYQLTADSVLQALDKSQIPSGILYDRTAGKAWLDGFNGAYNNADTSNAKHFLQAYYELRAATYNEPGNLPCRRLLADNAAIHRQRDTVLLGTLRYRFHTLDPQAVQNNLLSWDNATAPPRLLDVAGRARSPYLLHDVAVAAALADSTRNGTVYFRLDPASMFTNTGAALSSASITFDDGGPARASIPGQVMQVSYSTVGYKVLRYVLNYADGSQFITYSRLYVPKAACLNCASRGDFFVKPCFIEPLTAGIAHLGVAGHAEVSYFYSTGPSVQKDCNDIAQVITKPVIVVDGIDYTGVREGGDIFGEYLQYQDGSQTRNLGRQLQNEGHDVVILDFPNIEERILAGNNRYETITRHSGADYMERNAYTLVKLIQNINQQLPSGSTEQIVVVGPSMGGQIARFALAYMEKRYNDPTDIDAYQNPLWNHNTRLYISLDSPNNGATIPLGLQHFVKIFAAATEDEVLLEGLAELNSPAARQLSLQHHTQGTASLPDPLRNRFTGTLSSFGNGGYPSQLRRIAVTNGALDGTRQRDQNGQTIQAGEQAFYLQQKGVPSNTLAGGIIRLLWLAPFALPITTASARVYFAPGYGQVGRVARTYVIKPGSQHGERTPEGTGLAGSCSMDGAPGGYRHFFSFTNNSHYDDPFEKRTFFSVRDKACFIPMLSGLGYTQTADNCMAAGQNLVCAGTTSFDAYYGPTGHNEDHIQLTSANVEFMRNEILRKTPTPVFATAPNVVCPNGTIALAVAEPCQLPGRVVPITYTWTFP